MSRRSTAACLLAFALAATGCGDDNPGTTPTQPTPTEINETFSGTINRNGADTHNFVVTRSGLMRATLTSVAPDSTVVVGLSLGTWNGTTCQIVLANDNAAQNAQITGNAGSAGNFCVRIYDVGNVADTIDYQVTVVHF